MTKSLEGDFIVFNKMNDEFSMYILVLDAINESEIVDVGYAFFGANKFLKAILKAHRPFIGILLADWKKKLNTMMR